MPRHDFAVLAPPRLHTAAPICGQQRALRWWL